MEWQGGFSLFVILAVLVTLIVSRIPPYIVVMAALTVLSTVGILTPQEAFMGFSNEGLITVAAMFIVAAGVHSSGGIDLLVNHILGRPKTVPRAIARIFVPVLLLSGFLNNTPLVATMLPALLTWSKKIHIAPSKLLIPLSYAAILGGTITMIGTSTNLVTNGQYIALTGKEGFSLFSIAPIGIPVAIVGFFAMVFYLHRFLPDRVNHSNVTGDREFSVEVLIDEDGPLVNKTLNTSGLLNVKNLHLLSVENTTFTDIDNKRVLRANQRLVFSGDASAVANLLRISGVIPSAQNHEENSFLINKERHLVTAVVSKFCRNIGEKLHYTHLQERYDARILAIARYDGSLLEDFSATAIRAGDTLLLDAKATFAQQQGTEKDFSMVDAVEVERPATPKKAWLSWGILLVLVLCAATGLTTMLNASLLGAGSMLILGCCSIKEAEKSLSLPVLITIAASFALGAALHKTGVADLLARGIIELGAGKPWLILILVYISVSLLTEVISNNAAAILVLPIALGITQSLGLNDEPFVFAIMMAASSSFATPLGYQTNLMVYGPGAYTTRDFLRIGLPMNIIVAVVSLSVLLLFWPLTV